MRLLSILVFCCLVLFSRADTESDIDDGSGSKPESSDTMAVLMAVEAHKMAAEAKDKAEVAEQIADDTIAAEDPAMVEAAEATIDEADGVAEEDEPADDATMAEDEEIEAERRELEAEEEANEENVDEGDIRAIEAEEAEADAEEEDDLAEDEEIDEDEPEEDEEIRQLAAGRNRTSGARGRRVPWWKRSAFKLGYVVRRYIGWRNATRLRNYGCFCQLKGRSKKASKPVDDLDKCCQAVKSCRAGLSAGNFKTRTCKWGSRLLRSYRVACAKGACSCKDNTKSCRGATCGCDVTFASCVKSNWASYDLKKRNRC